MNKRFIVKQEEVSDCGVCSLLSIIRYYGGDISLENLRIMTNTTKMGVNAFNLIRCAQMVGFDAVGLKLEMEELSSIVPIIAHLKLPNNLFHFVVIYKIDKDVLMMDPSNGYKKISLKEFKDIFTGNIIKLTPKTKIINEIIPNELKKDIKQEIIKNKKLFIKITLLNILLILLTIIYSFYIKIFKDYIILIIFIFILFFKVLIEYLINRTSINIYKITSINLTNKFIKHIFNLPLKYLHLKDSGELIKRIDDYETVKNSLIEIIINILLNFLLIMGILLTLYFLNKKIIIYLIIFTIIFILLAYYKASKNKEEIEKVISLETNKKSMIIDYINGINSIKRSNHEVNYQNKLYKINNNYNDELKKIKLKLLKQNTTLKFFIGLFELIINTYLILYFNLKYFIIINFIIEIYINSLLEIENIIPNIIYIKSLIRKINEFYFLKEEKKDGLNFVKGNIDISNLTFSYNNLSNVINNFNLSIYQGEKIIIKGTNGVGKSTLLKIINKEYENYTGKVLINNINISKISLSSLRNHISYSSQNEHIFYGTIKDNILNENKISEKKLNDIINICKINNILKNRPFKLDTFLYGDNELSGGEKQQILLARSLVRFSDIYILDETLSEVNKILEEEILNNLFKYYNNKTIIYVTHKNIKNINARIIEM